MSRTSYPPPLSARDPNAFAYPTMKDRIPVILSKIVDGLTRNREKITKEHGGEAGREELKTVIGSISQLRYEVMTNKPAALLRDPRSDTSEWNTELERQIENSNGEEMKWFDSAWLWMECYLYRRIQEAPQLCTLLKGIDVFADQKQTAFTNSYKPISTLTMYVLEIHNTLMELVSESEVQRYFCELLQVSLWGNKCDLSISAGSENSQVHCPLEQLTKLKPFILIDDTNTVFQILSKVKAAQRGKGRVDIILDNAGFELVTDLCLADFLITSGLAAQVHFHSKAMPWFVSDVTVEDFNWTLKQMSRMNHLAISQLSHRWKKYLQEGTWVLEVNDFWTLPYDYSQMQERCPSLYSCLSESSFILFKGDLNYRKLVGDLQWDTTTDFAYSLRGFGPAPLCVLRTLKSDVVVGLKTGQAEETATKDANWMINGDWAVISACEGSRNTS